MNQVVQNIEKSDKKKNDEILEHIINMLIYRKWIKKENYNIVDKLKNIQNNDGIYEIKLDVNLYKIPTYEPLNDKSDSKNFNDDTIILYIHNFAINGISKDSPITSIFLKKYENYHRILLSNSISDKALNILLGYNHTEYFMKSSPVLGLLDHICSPQYEILTQDEGDELMKSYLMTKKQMNSMFDTDGASKYLYLKRKQIVKIIRNSELTTKSVCYRIVVHKGSN